MEWWRNRISRLTPYSVCLKTKRVIHSLLNNIHEPPVLDLVLSLICLSNNSAVAPMSNVSRCSLLPRHSQHYKVLTHSVPFPPSGSRSFSHTKVRVYDIPPKTKWKWYQSLAENKFIDIGKIDHIMLNPSYLLSTTPSPSICVEYSPPTYIIKGVYPRS